MSLTTTDLDVGVRCSVEAEVSKAGATTLPARKLFTILKEMPAAEVEVEVDEKNAAPGGKTISDHKVDGLKRASGHIGFCGHGDRVAFRNLRVKKL